MKCPQWLLMRWLVLLLVLGVWGCERVSDAAEHQNPAVLAVKQAPSTEQWQIAEQVYRCYQQRHQDNLQYLALVDFSLPSSEQRFWLLDMHTQQAIHQDWVAHGKGSGDPHDANLSTRFSDTPDSKQSSLGLYRAAETYTGRHGYSLRLDGLEPGFNGRARQRAIVMHGADYVSADFVAEHGRAGRSWGCPALPRASSTSMIDYLAEGHLVLGYYPDVNWLANSTYLNCQY